MSPALRLPVTSLLQYERSGWLATPSLVPSGRIEALRPVLDEIFESQQVGVLRQKVRVLLGADALAGARSRDARAEAQALRRLLAALPEGSVPFLQCFDTWRHSDDLLAFARSPELAGVASQLLGCSRVRLYQDSLFVKRAGDGETHWHADLAMAPLDTNSFVTAWLPLQPVPAEADGGTGLIYAGGSHRDVALPYWHGDPREAGDVSGRGYLEGTAGAMAVGDASWHHGWTLHCAAPNVCAEPRAALALSYFADGARRLRSSAGRAPDDEDAESSAEWTRAVPPGAPARHELLPLVWPPQKAARSAARSATGSAARSAARRTRGGSQARVESPSPARSTSETSVAPTPASPRRRVSSKARTNRRSTSS